MGPKSDPGKDLKNCLNLGICFLKLYISSNLTREFENSDPGGNIFWNARLLVVSIEFFANSTQFSAVSTQFSAVSTQLLP